MSESTNDEVPEPKVSNYRYENGKLIEIKKCKDDKYDWYPDVNDKMVGILLNGGIVVGLFIFGIVCILIDSLLSQGLIQF